MTTTLESTSLVGTDSGPHRYGVFLRPSPALIEESLRAYSIVSDQYGFTAAKAYPPHVTLVGSIALSVPEPVFVDVLEAVIADYSPFPWSTKRSNRPTTTRSAIASEPSPGRPRASRT